MGKTAAACKETERMSPKSCEADGRRNQDQVQFSPASVGGMGVECGCCVQTFGVQASSPSAKHAFSGHPMVRAATARGFSCNATVTKAQMIEVEDGSLERDEGIAGFPAKAFAVDQAGMQATLLRTLRLLAVSAIDKGILVYSTFRNTGTRNVLVERYINHFSVNSSISSSPLSSTAAASSQWSSAVLDAVTPSDSAVTSPQPLTPTPTQPLSTHLSSENTAAGATPVSSSTFNVVANVFNVFHVFSCIFNNSFHTIAIEHSAFSYTLCFFTTLIFRHDFRHGCCCFFKLASDPNGDAEFRYNVHSHTIVFIQAQLSYTSPPCIYANRILGVADHVVGCNAPGCFDRFCFSFFRRLAVLRSNIDKYPVVGCLNNVYSLWFQCPYSKFVTVFLEFRHDRRDCVRWYSHHTGGNDQRQIYPVVNDGQQQSFRECMPNSFNTPAPTGAIMTPSGIATPGSSSTMTGSLTEASSPSSTVSLPTPDSTTISDCGWPPLPELGVSQIFDKQYLRAIFLNPKLYDYPDVIFNRPTSIPATTSPAQSDQPSPSDTPLSSGQVAGIAVASSSAALIAAVAGLFLYRRHSQVKRTPKRPSVYPEVAYLYDPPMPPRPGMTTGNMPGPRPNSPTMPTSYSASRGIALTIGASDPDLTRSTNRDTSLTVNPNDPYERESLMHGNTPTLPTPTVPFPPPIASPPMVQMSLFPPLTQPAHPNPHEYRRPAPPPPSLQQQAVQHQQYQNYQPPPPSTAAPSADPFDPTHNADSRPTTDILTHDFAFADPTTAEGASLWDEIDLYADFPAPPVFGDLDGRLSVRNGAATPTSMTGSGRSSELDFADPRLIGQHF
ncbi:hypothetical protein K490DRAFT_52973 [Saccharata proteae CBS 121410]|uniref:Uncharacterized protein n=1 Tax=Saccharata proteae CBS 121410 TaxID=1314787 RepID=A0A9P4I1J2_9PEZI|nr:hypothetical protein K490DRAFT_52973 [Saccharata proteae CBS 121410]